MKRCSKCSKRLDEGCFSKCKARLDGLQSWCKNCLREYRQAHKEEIATQRREYWQNNKKEILTQQKKYKQAHKDEIATRVKKYYQAHREEILTQQKEYHKGYYQTPHGKIVIRRGKHKRRARKAQNGVYKVSDKFLCKLQNQLFCPHCGCKLTERHIDHVVPISRGGGHCEGNLQVLCPTCNLSKHNKLEVEVKYGMVSSNTGVPRN